MNDKLQKTLTDLAEKFGTSVEHLWGVLLYQARVQVITDLFYYVLCIVVGVVLYRCHIKFSKKYDAKYGSSCYYEDNDLCIPIMAVIGVIWIAYFIYCISSIGTTVSAAINPEYWALKEILPH